MSVKDIFIFLTDRYDEGSIKAQERLRRGISEKFVVDGPATRKPVDWKIFLQNDENKEQLCELLLKVWSSEDAVCRLEKCQRSLLIVNGKAFDLTVNDTEIEATELPELYSNHEETDSRVVLYIKYAEETGFKSALVRTPDSDIFFILLNHALSIKISIFIDIGVGKNRKIVDVSALAKSLGQEYCSCLLGLYVFTGEDCTSAFKGKGKIGPAKKLQRNPKYQRIFAKLGEDWSVSDELYEGLEAFTCLMYGSTRICTVNELRASMLRKMVGDDDKLSKKSKVELSRLPPCRDALRPHVKRVNYRIALYKRAGMAIVEKPKPYEEQGWVRIDDRLEPLWTEGLILPPSLVDLLDTTYQEGESNEEDGEEDGINDYEELLEYLDDDDDYV